MMYDAGLMLEATTDALRDMFAIGAFFTLLALLGIIEVYDRARGRPFFPIFDAP